MRGIRRKIFTLSGVLVAGAAFAGAAWHLLAVKPQAPNAQSGQLQEPRYQQFGQFVLWWDDVPAEIQRQRLDAGSGSNIHPADYADLKRARTATEPVR
jgi:hypothetical protein